MKELAAYLLLALSGKATPTADEIKAVLNSVGIESSDEELARLLAAVEGKVRRRSDTSSRNSDRTVVPSSIRRRASTTSLRRAGRSSSTLVAVAVGVQPPRPARLVHPEALRHRRRLRRRRRRRVRFTDLSVSTLAVLVIAPSS